MLRNLSSAFILSLGMGLVSANAGISQVTPDKTILTPSEVTLGCTNCIISGGIQRGGNLFHSFQEFSIPTGGQVLFNNGLDVQNIFSRVTGSQPSIIDGILRANGIANLFLINPNGIQFGVNAQLNIGGSFLATTADAVQFEDRTQFSAKSPTPLFSNRAPVGLTFTNPALIQVDGAGHQQLVTSLQGGFASRLAFTGQGQATSGLRVQPNQTLALIGGDVVLSGGLLTAPAGQVEIGSVKTGIVGLSNTASGFRFDYPQSAQLGSISLLKQSAIDTTGDRFSAIRLRGSTINLNDASLLVIENTGIGTVGDIELQADQQINVIGLTSFNRQDQLPLVQKISRSITSLTTSGTGANILLSSPNIRLTDSAYISALTLGNGNAGNIQVQANRLDIQGIAETEAAAIASSMTTSTYGIGRGGNIDINANQVEVSRSGLIYTTTYNLGQAGNISINSQTLSLDGGDLRIAVVANTFPSAALTFLPTSLGSNSVSSANSGNIFVQTQQLRVTNGAQFGTVSLVSGQAGTVTINASESVTVEGTARPTQFDLDPRLTPEVRQGLLRFQIDPSSVKVDRPVSSIIGSGGGLRNLFTEQVTNFSLTSMSRAGSVTIDSPKIQVKDARITVQNAGIGDAGELKLNANQIQLNRGGAITASTFSGNGGNVVVNADQLWIRDRSEITTNAGAGGNGGSIGLTSGVLAVLNNSRISANAERGRGGNVQITAQGVFNDRSSLISATSDRGPEFDGTVQINALESQLQRSSLRVLPTPEGSKIATICPSQADPRASTLIDNGTGGIPSNPTDSLSSRRGWLPKVPASTVRAQPISRSNPPTEIQDWVLNPDQKTIRLVVAGRGTPYATVTPFC
ncbi:two-partner secretion domain-containing protein [Leptolyngbya sp. GGD]|uniref:two-partner secretion domain-containing protein n=1 Tax=Leptolyngbya sp. GGD TaxID=2997907 RepID=UPI00227CFF8D|nr:filamentous hemagglutinin N-terminal domain-containing protein [Leptolyngbya sp. GGD]MCY6493841.1 filamentous hemagglutinin N-terminal domain-containing protein [Leptolyngbya sp. GGD]